jgi:hypothetical protein
MLIRSVPVGVVCCPVASRSAFARFKVPLSQVRQPDLPRGSDEQLYAEAFLKTRHRTADRSRIDACGRSGGRETSQFSRQTEQFDTAQQETFKLTLHTLSMT